MYNSKPILLIEDDNVDVMAVTRAFEDLHIPNRLVLTASGEEALEYLNGADTETPCVILLDLNMPRMTGLEFLDTIKHDQRFKHIPVIVLTTSNKEEDVNACFELCVAGYMVKPVDYMKFAQIISVIDSYWTLSKLPKK